MWIAEVLEDHLPNDFKEAAIKIVRSLPPPLDESQTDDDFGDFIFAPLGEYVVRHGLHREHLDLSLRTLKELTKRFSMEDATRAFLRKFPKETVSQLTRWAQDANYHVRRLVSESTRPLLPWSGRIDLPVQVAIPLLDTLHADRTRYVTRSVANHLNDIAKTSPELVVETLQRWHDQSQQDPAELNWITRHALRTLIKRGHAQSLKLLGFNPTPKLTISEIRLTKTTLRPGETLEFSLDVVALRNESLVVDYAIDFVKAGGKRSVKVSRRPRSVCLKGEAKTINKKHKLHAQATTYQLYAGEHTLTIQINGQPVGTQRFTIV